MTTTMLWIWAAVALLLVLAVLRRLALRWSARRSENGGLDDDAIARILSHGTLSTPDDEPLDEDEIARAEEEFWDESWDEPDEY